MEVNFLGLRRRSPRRFWRQPVSLSRTRCLKHCLGACIIVLCPFSFHKRNNRSTKMSAHSSHTNWSWISIGWLHKGVSCSGSLPTSLEFERPLERGYDMDSFDNHENLTQELLWISWMEDVSTSLVVLSLGDFRKAMSIKKGIRRLQKSKIRFVIRKEKDVSVEILSIL